MKPGQERLTVFHLIKSLDSEVDKSLVSEVCNQLPAVKCPSKNGSCAHS